MKETNRKENRGGRREGAGRPKGTSRLYTFRADKEIAHFIDTQKNKTDFIHNCIIKEMQAQTVSTNDTKLSNLGEIYPAKRIEPVTLPFFDIKIVAGFPIPLDNDELAQDIELIKMLCPHPDSSYLIRVQGNSMIDAGINDGSILIVDKSNRNPSEKEIAVCELNGEYTVKRVQEINGKKYLVPANPDYPNIEIMEGDDFSVWGVVTYVISKPTY